MKVAEVPDPAANEAPPVNAITVRSRFENGSKGVAMGKELKYASKSEAEEQQTLTPVKGGLLKRSAKFLINKISSRKFRKPINKLIANFYS